MVQKLHMTEDEMASYKYAKKVSVQRIQASSPRCITHADGASMHYAGSMCTALDLASSSSGLCLQDKAAEREARAALLNSIRPKGSKLKRVSSMPAVFAVLVRLRQACTHFSLLPPEMQLAWRSSDTSSEETEGKRGKKAKGKAVTQSLATRLDGIQTRRGQSTKMKRVLRIIQVCPACIACFPGLSPPCCRWCLEISDSAVRSFNCC